MAAIKILHNQLSPEALHGVVEEFVTRDGTDYGEVEISLETKIFEVLAQLKSGNVIIVFDQTTETCTILKSDDPSLKNIKD